MPGSTRDRREAGPQRSLPEKGRPALQAAHPDGTDADSGARFGSGRGKYVEMNFIPADGPTRPSGIGYAVGLDDFRHIRAASM